MGQTARTLDVAVVGAGAAGLSAATALAAAGCAVEVLEARPRIGGRILTSSDPDLAWPIELGAEFIHGRAPTTAELLARAGMLAIDTVGTRLTVRDSAPRPREDIFSGVRELMGRVSSLAEDDLSVDEFLSREARDPKLAEACAHARRMAEGFDAADPARASVRAIAHEWESMDGGNARPAAGYGVLMAQLARELAAGHGSVRLETEVDAIDWTQDDVRVEGHSPAGRFVSVARRALLTVPVSILQLAPSAPGAIGFTPPLTEKAIALRGIALGPVLKVILRFGRAFWEAIDGGRLRHTGFLHAPDAAFPTFWTALPARVPLLTAWMGGPRAERMRGAGRDALVTSALQSLESLFGPAERCTQELAAAYVQDWQQDPYARGAYSYITVGGLGAPDALARPLHDRLYFAGEATSSADAGTVEAALQSGRRAAREILESLRGSA